MCASMKDVFHMVEMNHGNYKVFDKSKPVPADAHPINLADYMKPKELVRPMEPALPVEELGVSICYQF